MNRLQFFAILLGAGSLLSGCAVGPDYEKPDAPTPAAFKEQSGWKASEPADALDRGSWWGVYSDPVLDGLEKKIDVSNQTLRASEAAYRQSQAVVDEARASYWPTISGGASQTRSQSGSGSTGGQTVSGPASSFLRGASAARNEYSLSANASWAPDIWGKIRRTVESDVASAQASAADLASARLSAQATLATDYFELRTEDELERLFDRTVDDFQRSLTIAQNQYNVGVAAKADVLSAQTQLMNAQASAINVGVLRAQLEHAIAVLVGEPPAGFSIPAGPMPSAVPTVPAGLPSTLLERRPDIAGAERRMASANAQIGVAISAYFPDLSLTGSYGSSSSQIGNLLSTSTRVWSFGPSLAETIFDAGLRGAQVDQARASYDEAVANYRQTVLTGFQQVEDELSGLRILAQQAVVEEKVVKTAQEAERLTLNQYKAGTVPYSSVITAQTTALGTEETALNVLESRLTASVTLIEALGGGWAAGKLPDRDQVEDSDVPMPVVAGAVPAADKTAP